MNQIQQLIDSIRNAPRQQGRGTALPVVRRFAVRFTNGFESRGDFRWNSGNHG